MLTIDQVAAFDRDGFVLVEGMFSQEEADVLLKAVGEASRVDAHTFEARDVDGNVSKLSLWTDIGEDAFGAVSASPRIVNSMQILLRENVCHWHSKVILKEATKGGAWEWHQDYGYWYHDGCPYPRMASAMLALDEATRENGCLKVMVSSHLLGRLEHGREGTQQGAELQRLAALDLKTSCRSITLKQNRGVCYSFIAIYSMPLNPTCPTALVSHTSVATTPFPIFL